MDNAFTRSSLKEKIYMRVLEGMNVKKGYVLLVLKSLYGLKQGAYEWNQRCDKILRLFGLVPIPSDPCIYFCKATGFIVGVYVDDLLILALKGK